MVCPEFFPKNSNVLTAQTGSVFQDSIVVTCIRGHYIYQGQVGMEDNQYTALCDESGNWNLALDCESEYLLKNIRKVVHSVSLNFRLRLSLSVNSQMAIWLYTSHSNYHLIIHTQKHKYFLF